MKSDQVSPNECVMGILSDAWTVSQNEGSWYAIHVRPSGRRRVVASLDKPMHPMSLLSDMITRKRDCAKGSKILVKDRQILGESVGMLTWTRRSVPTFNLIPEKTEKTSLPRKTASENPKQSCVDVELDECEVHAPRLALTS